MTTTNNTINASSLNKKKDTGEKKIKKQEGRTYTIYKTQYAQRDNQVSCCENLMHFASEAIPMSHELNEVNGPFND